VSRYGLYYVILCQKVLTMKNDYLERVCLNGIKGSKKGECRYKTMNGKAVFQLPEEKNRRKLCKSVWPKIEL
jgi:hypothetical protein